MTENRSRLYGALIRLLTPLVRILLRRGVSYTEFSELAKRVFVHVADSDFTIEGRKQTASRVAILTGITRKDVAKLRNKPLEVSPDAAKHNRAARVVSGWLRDSDFHDAMGNPRPLETLSDESEFAQLIRRYSGDMPVRAVLDELIRVESVQKDEDGYVRLSNAGYVPQQDEAMLDLFGQSACDLLNTLDHNLSNPSVQSRLQLSAVHDGIPHDEVLRFKRFSEQRALALLKELDARLSEATPATGTPASSDVDQGYRTGIGIYFIEQALPHNHDSKN